ncbi:MAG: hypothetical protein HDR86_03220 [Bacteroides sp.]|nr:hypothetical protein [Bacteroides sp.]
MLTQISKAEAALASFRKNRELLKEFTFGRQLQDLPDGSGRLHLTNNLIHQLVKTLVGHFRQQEAEKTADDHNRLAELDARMFEEFLISGAAIQHISRERRPGFREELTWVDNVSPANFFAYPLRDPRALDIEIIGMRHDWSLGEAIARLACGSRQAARELHQRLLMEAYDKTPGFERCLITEVWTREIVEVFRCHDRSQAKLMTISEQQLPEIARMNRAYKRTGKPKITVKMEMKTQWVGRFLTPSGFELDCRRAEHHPFAVKFYPLLDGEIHSFVAGLVDQQKFVNRLVNQVDNMMTTSAKGVLLFPEDELAENFSLEQVAERWSSFDGVIPYLPRLGSEGPKQVVTNPSDCGAYELLNIQMQFFDRISGISNALRGTSDGGNSAQLFDAQTRNSLAAIADTFAAFRDFQSARERLKA